MNTAAKGRRREHQSRALLEREGFRVIRSAASLGPFDLVAFRADVVALVQVRANRPPAPIERTALEAFPCPPGVRKLVHVWRDRVGLLVTELGGHPMDAK